MEAISARWRTVLTIAVLGIVLVGGVAAQSSLTQTWNDDFEDGDVAGWDGTNFGISTSSVEGNYSLRAEDGHNNQSLNPEWVNGPVLDLSKEFVVRGTSRINQDPSSLRAGFGIVHPTGDGGAEGVILLFSSQHNATFIARSVREDPAVSGAETIGGFYDNEWVEWRLESSGNGTVTATIWGANESMSQGVTITRTFSSVEPGQFTVFSGADDVQRVSYLDNVTISGQEATDPSLGLETRRLFRHGETHEYRVYELRNESGNNVSYTVTENASVESLNTTLITVNEANNTLVATSDESVSGVALVRATYNNSTTYAEVTVAKPTVKNLQIVPGIWRINAVIGDSFLFALLVATLLGVPAARYTSAFGGLALAQMVLVVGWLGGYVGFGMAAVSVFVSLFIGLNLAANINYMGGRLGGGR